MFSSRLTRWIDRLLTFDMEVIHQPGSTMGLVDYLSCQSTEKVRSKYARELWESRFTVQNVDMIPEAANEQMNKLFRQPIKSENAENATVRAKGNAES